MAASNFPIPSILQDLERDPYHLNPYPEDFNGYDEAARGESFEALVHLIEQGNRCLTTALVPGSEDSEDDDDEVKEEWIDRQRFQALYTLVRKSTSLTPGTRESLIYALSQAVTNLSDTLHKIHSRKSAEAVPQTFRDVFACHLYFLYSLMFQIQSNEGDSKVQESPQRQACASAMLTAATAMANCRNTFWQRGVPDESVVLLPCRIAYPLLERATGVIARKGACADEALKIIAATVQFNETVLGTVTAALIDLMHSHEHMAPLVSELCDLVGKEGEVVNPLAVDLMREMGRLDGNETNKASGIKNVAPFLPLMATLQPRLFLQHLPHVLPHLQSESHSLRSAVVQSVVHLLEYLGKNETNAQKCDQQEQSDGHQDTPATHQLSKGNKTRIALLNLLTERIYDVSSFTRSAVLKAWITLIVSGTLPKDRIAPVTRIAIDRLQDKTVAVRKQSMQLLTTLLENHPFVGALDPTPYRDKLSELYTFVKENMPAYIREAQDLNSEVDDEEAALELEQATLATAMSEADVMLANGDDSLTDLQREYCSKVQALKITQSALEFIELFEDATVALQGMLLSANTSDVTEALRFFVQARHFRLPCAVTGMKQALALMWSSEQAVRDEVLKAFIDVFIAIPGTEGTELLSDQQITKNLIILTAQATVSELASIEEAIQRLVKEERIPSEVFVILWSVACQGTADNRIAALRILSMGAGADRSIVDSKSRLKMLLDSGFGEFMYERKDWQLAAAAAMALQRIGRARIDPSDAKYLVLERIIEELCSLAQGDECSDEKDATLRWFSAAEQAIKALFVISPAPEKDCSKIVNNLYHSTLGDGSQCHSLRLARFFHVLGQIALNLLVYTEALSASVRTSNARKALKRQEDADKKKSRKGGPPADHDAIEDELGLAAEVEAENERKLAEITETEILGRGLISPFAPLLVRVIANEGGAFDSEVLMQASMLALCKFMCVSSSFCEKHLPLLFTALSNAPSEDITMRANTVIALGDLAFRFPNEVEPYTPRMYACLRDPSTTVRRHSLMVLTHLILNDMVKVKGQVCEIALCLKDEDPRIRDMSRLLFHEFSKRSNNPIYNLLPDIISQLSQFPMEKEEFRGIMSFLLAFIKKERQNEMLAEKLCQRFPNATTIGQKADLAYCMAQLKMTERAIKSLSDNFKLYKDALFDDDVKKSFMSIVTKAKKLVKPENRQSIEEWESRLNESANQGAEDQVVDQKAAQARNRALKRAAQKKQKATMIRIEEGEDDEEEDVDDQKMDLESSTKPKSARKVPPPRRAHKSRIALDEDDDLVDSEEEPEQASEKENKPKQKSGRRGRPAGGRAQRNRVN